jgi:hypothetical protein
VLPFPLFGDSDGAHRHVLGVLDNGLAICTCQRFSLDKTDNFCICGLVKGANIDYLQLKEG